MWFDIIMIVIGIAVLAWIIPEYQRDKRDEWEVWDEESQAWVPEYEYGVIEEELDG